MWPRILWWAPVEWLLKESNSKICSWQVTHLEVHLNIPCWMGGMEQSLVGGTSAHTRRSLRLGGHLKAIIGSSGIARWRQYEVWRIWWLALVIWRMGVERDDRWQQEEPSYWHSLGLWASQKVLIAWALTWLSWWLGERPVNCDVWTQVPVSDAKISHWSKFIVVWGPGYRLCWPCSAGDDN